MSQQKISFVWYEIVILFHVILQTSIAKFRKISTKFSETCQFGGLDPGHVPNQIRKE
jgi:hypothetical protein